MSEKDYVRRKNKWLPKIKAWIDEHSSVPTDDKNDLFSRPTLIPLSVKLESDYSQLETPEDKQAYLRKMGEDFGEPDKDGSKNVEVKSVLPKIIQIGYQALQLCYFFTAGADEVRAWTLRVGTKAPQAAGVMYVLSDFCILPCSFILKSHTDFERGFIMAEVMKFADLKEIGNETAVKAAGKYLQKGKEYVVDDGDVIFFKFNVTNSAKKK